MIGVFAVLLHKHTHHITFALPRRRVQRNSTVLVALPDVSTKLREPVFYSLGAAVPGCDPHRARTRLPHLFGVQSGVGAPIGSHIHGELVHAHDELEAVLVIELPRDVRAEGAPSAARRKSQLALPSMT